MKVYDGTSWVIAYIPSGGYLPLIGGTMTGTLTVPSAILTGNLGVGQTPNYGTSGQILKSAGPGAPPTWNDLVASYSYLPVYTNSASIIQVSVANGYVPVTTRTGSTVNISVT
jgi:hypothetical protein